MKKSLLLILPALFFLITGCGNTSSVTEATSSAAVATATSESKYSFSDPVIGKNEAGFKTITYDDIIDGKTLTFRELPDSYTRVSTKGGTVEQLEYDTSVYGESHVYHKKVNVYLPYGYDAGDTETKYNVIYFQHGNGEQSESSQVRPGTETLFKKVLDNLFDDDKGNIDPAIVVFVTHWLDDDHTIRGDEEDGDRPAALQKEYVKDVLPLIEGHYNTYTENTSEEGLIASREHRCFSGYSNGSANTWRTFLQDFPYFRWYMPLSGSFFTDYDATYAEMKQVIDDNAGMDYYIYCIDGGKKDLACMQPWMNYLSKKEGFEFGTDTSVDHFYYLMADFDHADQLASYYYYETLQVIFH